jgi:hypothetical protein
MARRLPQLQIENRVLRRLLSCVAHKSQTIMFGSFLLASFALRYLSDTIHFNRQGFRIFFLFLV